jgi:tetratricopeptide (TPR) repeat protein
MKRIFSTLSLILVFANIYAQDITPGKEFFYYKRFASAENFFHDYLRQQPASGEGWLWLVKSYAEQQKFQAISDTMEKAPSTIQKDAFFLVAKGIQNLLNKSRNIGREYFNQAIEVTKGRNLDIILQAANAQAYGDSDDFDYGLNLIQGNFKKNRNNSTFYLVMGNLFLAKHDGTEAYKAYRDAIEKDSKNAEAYYQMGRIFLTQKNADMYLDYFKKAVEADDKYAAAWYELYSHYRYSDPLTAMNYFREYTKTSDANISQDYAYTDLLYLGKDYSNAIESAKQLLKKEGAGIQPRIYKLLAYSYAELKDTSMAIIYMTNYLRDENDSNFITKDFETMAGFYSSRPGMEDSIITFYKKAIYLSTDSVDKKRFYKELAVLSNSQHDYSAESEWRGKYYENNTEARNIDLFNWGLASYRSENYALADSVFGLYTAKYPEQGFGYYWRARSNAALDTSLALGLAIPHYQKLVSMISSDTTSSTNKKWLLEAYNYLAAWETNAEKDYTEAIGYFNKILELDPENSSARKYAEILEESLKKSEEGN